MSERTRLTKIAEYIWEIPMSGGMLVPGRIFANDELIKAIERDETVRQVQNVAHLPGIVRYSMAMPDAHQGYGFPIGGVAATDVDEGGVISPGGVGYDINCGCRICVTNLEEKDVRPRLRQIVNAIFDKVPCGLGSSGGIKRLSQQELADVLATGARWAVRKGYGTKDDLERTEEKGCLQEADPSCVSQRAMQRGLSQLGTLGSGNHFLEICVVSEVYDEEVAHVLGFSRGRVCLQIHSGSRGLGHQTCDDWIRRMFRAVEKYGYTLPDRELACAPVNSPEGKEYLAAMNCAANFAWANRQIIMALAAEAVAKALGVPENKLGMRLVYDVCHNIAKIERHMIDGRERTLCVHRKGATRAFGPRNEAVPRPYRDIGQPVLIPGDMGTCSYVCVGTQKAMEKTFGSTCHGAGRVLSRHAAKRASRGRSIDQELSAKGIVVRARSRGTLAEEMPEAYKDVTAVVDVMHELDVSRKVVQLKPMGVVKG